MNGMLNPNMTNPELEKLIVTPPPPKTLVLMMMGNAEKLIVIRERVHNIETTLFGNKAEPPKNVLTNDDPGGFNVKDLAEITHMLVEEINERLVKIQDRL